MMPKIPQKIMLTTLRRMYDGMALISSVSSVKISSEVVTALADRSTPFKDSLHFGHSSSEKVESMHSLQCGHRAVLLIFFNFQYLNYCLIFKLSSNLNISSVGKILAGEPNSRTIKDFLP